MSTVIEPTSEVHEGHAEADAHVPGAHKSTTFYVKVALGPDGRGVVVWDENGGGDVNVVRVSAR